MASTKGGDDDAAVASREEATRGSVVDFRPKAGGARSSRGGGGGAGGGDSSSDMDVRVNHLEERIGRVEGKLDTIIERLAGIATRSDMRNYVFTALGLMVAV